MMQSLRRVVSRIALVAVAVGIVGLTPKMARANVWFNCVPTQVLEFNNRVHVGCSNGWTTGGSQIRYLAINKNDAEKLGRFVAFANAALLSNRFFRVYITASSASNVSGCGQSNCRTPTSFGVLNR